jgi:hypothetical protein
MPGHGEKRSRKTSEVIAALLSEPTTAAAAAKVGVHVKTLLRWLREPSFLAAYRQARRQVVEHVIARLQQLGDKAALALERVLDDPDGRPQDKVRSATAVLDRALRGVELIDILERVETLEAARGNP